MESELICLDTSVLIDYFRKTNKKKSFLAELTQKYSHFAVSIIPFDINSNIEAISMYKTLKKEGNLIDIDLFISPTAKAHNLKIATLNVKHFNRIHGLNLVQKSN